MVSNCVVGCFFFNGGLISCLEKNAVPEKEASVTSTAHHPFLHLCRVVESHYSSIHSPEKNIIFSTPRSAKLIEHPHTIFFFSSESY